MNDVEYSFKISVSGYARVMEMGITYLPVKIKNRQNILYNDFKTLDFRQTAFW
jgi:hypothetical protein